MSVMAAGLAARLERSWLFRSWVLKVALQLLLQLFIWAAVAAFTLGPAILLGQWIEGRFAIPPWPMFGLGGFAFALLALAMLSDRPRRGYVEVGPLAAVAGIGGMLAAMAFAARAYL
jgi:hypothetical protein